MGRLVPLPGHNQRKTPAAGRGPARARPPGPPRPFRPANDNRPPWREMLLRVLFWTAFAALGAAWVVTS